MLCSLFPEGKRREEQTVLVITSCTSAEPVRRGLQTIRNPKERGTPGAAEPFKTAGMARTDTSWRIPFSGISIMLSIFEVTPTLFPSSFLCSCLWPLYHSHSISEGSLKYLLWDLNILIIGRQKINGNHAAKMICFF